jgi:hypothetical protein
VREIVSKVLRCLLVVADVAQQVSASVARFSGLSPRYTLDFLSFDGTSLTGWNFIGLVDMIFRLSRLSSALLSMCSSILVISFVLIEIAVINVKRVIITATTGFNSSACHLDLISK